MADTKALKKRIQNLEQEIDYLKQIIEHIPTHMYWKDKKGIYQGCNQSQARALGLDSPENIKGKTTAELLGKDHAAIIEKNDKKIMKTQEEQRTEEVAIFKGNQQPGVYLSIKAPLYNKKKKVSGLLGVSIDITKIKEAEQALIEAKQKAEEISRMKSEFIHNMEHDIRTPFAGIHGMSATLARQETDPEKRECLNLIAESSKELLDYANHILAFAKLEEEHEQIIFKEFSIDKLIKAVITMEQPPAKMKNLELNYSISKNVPDIVISDAARLKSILINLTSNAIKFTEHGSVSIHVELLTKNETDATLLVKVTDTGIGIPENKQKFIYDKFFRINPSNQGLYKGFGIGLQVVKKFVEELNGKLTLESSVNKGTTFTFTLPIKLPIQVNL